MSCPKCPKEQARFSTDKEFESKQSQLDAMTENGEMKYLGEDKADKEAASFSVIYRCVHCSSLWRLRIPDHAYRGEFSQIK